MAKLNSKKRKKIFVLRRKKAKIWSKFPQKITFCQTPFAKKLLILFAPKIRANKLIKSTPVVI